MTEARIGQQVMYVRSVCVKGRLAFPYSQRKYPDSIENGDQHHSQGKQRRSF